MSEKRVIYLDNAATTRVADEVAAVVADCMCEDYGNPSSAHHYGIAAEARLKKARDQFLAAVGDPRASVGNLLWTSGGTESDALGVIGAARALRRRGDTIIVSAVEHPAVRESAAQLEAEGFRVLTAEVTRGSGALSPATVAHLVDERTVVVAVMLVNNEIGTVHPVAEIATAVRQAGKQVHIHCDAVQALGKIPVDVVELGADSVAFAAHKLHGPKGVGALWLKKSARLAPLWSGGGQQDGVRSGTFNVPGIAGFGAAVERAVIDLGARRDRYQRFTEVILGALRAADLSFLLNGQDAPRAGHVLSLAFPGCPAEPLLHVMESRGVLVSAGSACSERDRKPSPVLTAIGLPADYGTVRISFGADTRDDEVATAAEILVDAVRSFAS